MCQTEDHFDCQPAVLAALDFAKTANNGGIEDPEMAKKIDFEEFGAFLQAVKLYYSFCEVNEHGWKFCFFGSEPKIHSFFGSQIRKSQILDKSA